MRTDTSTLDNSKVHVWFDGPGYTAFICLSIDNWFNLSCLQVRDESEKSDISG